MSTRFQSVSRFMLVLALFVMLIFGLAPAVAQDGPTSDPNDPLIAYMLGWRDTIITPTEQVSEEDAAAYRSASFIWHDPFLPSVTKTGSEYIGLVFSNDMRRVTTDNHYVFDQIVRYGDLVWAHYTDETTLQSPLPYDWAMKSWSHLQLPMELRTDGVIVARIKDGEFAEWWEYADSPVVSYAHEYFLCNGWPAPLAASDMGPSDVASVPDHTLLMEGEKITLVQQLFDRTINNFKQGYGTMMKASIIVHDPRGPEVWILNPGSIRQWFMAMHEMMPDFHMEIKHIVEHEDMVWVHWRSTSTLTNPTTHPGLLNINTLERPRAVEAEGVYLFRFEDDEIAEWWWYEDNILLTIANAGLCFTKGF